MRFPTKAEPTAASAPCAGAIRIAGLYLIIAGLYLACSDALVVAIVGNGPAAHRVQMIKGFGFVAVTAGLLFVLCYRRFVAQQQIRARLREQHRQHRTLIGNLPGIAYRCLNDEHWTTIFVSQGCCELCGYEPEALVERRITWEQITHADHRQRVRTEVERAVRRGERFHVEYQIVTADGRHRWVWEQGTGVYDADGRVIALEGFITDITDRRNADRLERERDRFREAHRAMERSLGVVGHELRAPLASLRAISEYLLTDVDDLSEQTRKFIQAIHDESTRLTEMANHMLDADRLSSGLHRWQWSQVDLTQVTHDAIEVVRPLIDPAAIKLRVSLPARPLTMRGDNDAIRRLALNLLTNACRHTTRGHVEIDVEPVHEDDATDPRCIRITVRDTGPGLDADTVARLGVAYAYGRPCGDLHAHYGAGLGLAICRHIVAAHGGRLVVESEPGRGAAFIATLRADLLQPEIDQHPAPIAYRKPNVNRWRSPNGHRITRNETAA